MLWILLRSYNKVEVKHHVKGLISKKLCINKRWITVLLMRVFVCWFLIKIDCLIYIITIGEGKQGVLVSTQSALTSEPWDSKYKLQCCEISLMLQT